MPLGSNHLPATKNLITKRNSQADCGMVSEARKHSTSSFPGPFPYPEGKGPGNEDEHSMAWMETDYSKDSYALSIEDWNGRWSIWGYTENYGCDGRVPLWQASQLLNISVHKPAWVHKLGFVPHFARRLKNCLNNRGKCTDKRNEIPNLIL